MPPKSSNTEQLLTDFGQLDWPQPRKWYGYLVYGPKHHTLQNSCVTKQRNANVANCALQVNLRGK